MTRTNVPVDIEDLQVLRAAASERAEQFEQYVSGGLGETEQEAAEIYSRASRIAEALADSDPDGANLWPTRWVQGFTDQDAAELEWWRHTFRCRFKQWNLPAVGEALLGHELRLAVVERDGTLTPWTREGYLPGETGR